jgi:phospholipid/cholesterol/gamma-HCH transport system permease protein
MVLMRPIRSAVLSCGEFSIFGFEAIRNVPRLWRRWGIFLKQCEFIGVSSTGILTVAALFMGGVLGYQLYVSFHYFGAEALLGGSVGISLFRELAPVMAAIMVTGRSGAAMAAQLSSMRISEQIDALEVMAVDPVEYLVTPRITAGLLMMPLLSMYFAVIATLASMGIACGVMGLDQAVFWDQFKKVVDRIDVIHCVVKGAAFGLILTWVACYFGFRATGGARAVGYATRTTVVATFLMILCSDYILTSILPFGFAYLSVT